MKKASILLLLAISFSACLKFGDDSPSNEFHITGRVLAYGTNEPVAGATVRAIACTGVKDLTDPCVFRTVATDTTDEQGRYEFDAKDAMLVSASKTNYDSRNTEETVDGDSGERVIDIVIQPDAWLDISIKNTSGATRLNFALDYTQNFRLPKDSTARVFSKVGGNKNRVIELGVYTVDGKYIRRDDTVYCRGLDTIFHYIEY